MHNKLNHSYRKALLQQIDKELASTDHPTQVEAIIKALGSGNQSLRKKAQQILEALLIQDKSLYKAIRKPIMYYTQTTDAKKIQRGFYEVVAHILLILDRRANDPKSVIHNPDYKIRDLKAYAVGIAKNYFKTHLRELQKQAPVDITMLSDSKGLTTKNQAFQDEKDIAFTLAWQQLSEDERELLFTRFDQNVKSGDLPDKFNYEGNVGAARTHLYRVKNKFKDLYQFYFKKVYHEKYKPNKSSKSA